MANVDKLISDREGNHLLVALDFYDTDYKVDTLKIPPEFSDIEIIDIAIAKRDLDSPIHFRALFEMSRWILEQFLMNPNAVFTFICSTDALTTNHNNISPQEYRWKLFDSLYQRICRVSNIADIQIQDIIIGPEGYMSFGRAFYRNVHSPIINIVSSYLKEKQN